MHRLSGFATSRYASCKLTETEQGYAMIEKESLAMTLACENFDFFLVGTDFEIDIDHKPLVPPLGEKYISTLPLCVQRFKLHLMR